MVELRNRPPDPPRRLRGRAFALERRRAPAYSSFVMKSSETSLADPQRFAEVLEKVERVVELMRPAIQSDGGDLEFVEMTPAGLVRIRLHGACVGCPSSEVTLQAGIERNLRAHVPAVVGVESVD